MKISVKNEVIYKEVLIAEVQHPYASLHISYACLQFLCANGIHNLYFLHFLDVIADDDTPNWQLQFLQLIDNGSLFFIGR